MQFDLSRRLGAEALGTGLLLATVVGSGIMAEALAGGNPALALLCNAVATGAILIVLITLFGPVSGAHFNPAVTLVMTLRGEVKAGEGGLYAAAQVIGGVFGVWTAHLMFDLDLFQLSQTVRTGPGQWFAEAVACFGLVLTILVAGRFRREFVPAGVGLYIVAAYWFTASTSFANPAVTVARSLSDTFAGIAPADAAGFVLAQFTGAIVALSFAGWLLNGANRERAE